MKYFGENWGAPICKDIPHVQTPDVNCYLCKEPFAENAQGLIMPFAGGPIDDVPSINHSDGSCEVACHLRCFKICVGIKC